MILSGLLCLGGTAQAQAPNWPSERAPRPLPAHDIKFPPYQIQTLANGLQVVAVSHGEQPAVSMRLLVRTGSAADPKGKLGLAHLLADLLDQGTTTKSAHEMNDDIDFIGGSMDANATSDLTSMRVVVMKDSFETGLRMLADMAEHPAFAKDEIERQRQQILSTLQVNAQDTGNVADAVFDRLVYGFHPYGMPDEGTPETVASITREDLVAFHQRYFAPSNAILAIVGDVTADEAFAMAKKVFGDWAPHDVPRDKITAPPDPARRVIVINKPDAVQTEIRVGHLGIARTNPDYMAVNLAIRILGGEGANRLHQVLRAERSLTYGAQADFDALRDAGDFEATTSTRTEATGEVLRLIVDEFWRLQRERVSEGELAGAKAYMTGSFPLTIETPDAIATQVLNTVFYGLPVQQIQTFRDRVNAVTPDDIERVARYYLQPDRVSVVLVGNAAGFVSQLRGLGFGRFETIDIDNLDLLAADFKRAGGTGRAGRAGGAGGAGGALRLASFQKAVAPEEGPRAKALLEKVIAAKGGLARLSAVKTIKAVTAATVKSPTGNLDTETVTYLAYPDRVRVETKMPQGTQIQAYDRGQGWARDTGGVRELPAQALREVEASLQRDTITMLLAAHRGELRTQVLPDVKDASGKLSHALEMSGPGFDPIVLQVDPATNMVTRQSWVLRAPGQPLVEELFSDYRVVDGVQVAFLAEVRQAGRLVVLRHISQIAFNVSIDPLLFRRPAS